MKNALLILILIPYVAVAQHKFKLETSDIDNFWIAFDSLQTAKTKADSIKVIQEFYFNKSTKNFKKFAKSRHFTPEEYTEIIGKYPKFWASIRPLMQNRGQLENEINEIYQRFSELTPRFHKPNICLAVGCIRSGGTTSQNLILIGVEIAVNGESIDKSELPVWQKSVVGKTGIIPYIAHEAVHTMQRKIPWKDFFKLVKYRRFSLLNSIIVEGSADFITQEFLGMNINAHLNDYGAKNECQLWNELVENIETAPFDLSKWLYNGNAANNRPADLGYFMGRKISEQFYKNQEDKSKALITLLNRAKYQKILELSNYKTSVCN